MRLLAAVLAIGAFSSASADESMPEVVIPSGCERYYDIPGGMDSPVAWSQVFSFAACIQDARVVRVDDASELPMLVEQLDTEMMPALKLYAAALQEGPDDVKLRAAYHVGMSQVALLTRLRISAGKSRTMRQKLEPLLEDTALLAWKSFAMIEVMIASDPSIASDPVTKAMVKAAREMGASLSVAFAVTANEQTIIAR